VHRNVATIHEVQGLMQRDVGRHQRAIEYLTRKIARPGSLYALLALVVGWTSYNLSVAHLGWRVPDPAPFFWLQGLVSFFAALVATMVLITQSRQNREAEQRAHLDLQVNLLAEQKTAKIIGLLEELRRDLPVRDRKDTVATAMQEELDPNVVLRALESTIESEDLANGVGTSRATVGHRGTTMATQQTRAKDRESSKKMPQGSTGRAEQPSDTGVSDDVYGLVSVLYHSLQGAENYSDYGEDARAAGDDEASGFFDECRDEEIRRAQRALQLLSNRIEDENGEDEDEDNED
jgi:uncharacterized membrane protein